LYCAVCILYIVKCVVVALDPMPDHAWLQLLGLPQGGAGKAVHSHSARWQPTSKLSNLSLNQKLFAIVCLINNAPKDFEELFYST
jgi:hypothetical protein